MSRRTEETYVRWVRRYIDFHGSHNPPALGPVELERFVTHLAEAEGLSAPSVSQAASAVVFMHRELFGQELGGRHGPRTKKPAVLPKYATPDEIARILSHLRGVPLAAAMLMYGSGTRIAETLAIRLKDVSLETRELHVRGRKGAKDRTTVIAAAAVPVLLGQMDAVAARHALDLDVGGGWASRAAATCTPRRCSER